MKPRKPKPKKIDTSWQKVGSWYDQSVGREGHYYHQHIVLPGVLKLLQALPNHPRSLLDLGCGQGVLARQLPPDIDYLGVDLSEHLIKQARSYDKSQSHRYLVHDITEPLAETARFSVTTLILSLQNIEKPDRAIQNARKMLREQGYLLIVLNHPCFRIPRQSFWQVDEKKQCRFRRLERYLTPMKIPIQMKPSMGEQSPLTWSFHHPLSSYCKWLHESGFTITSMEEWCSDKVSIGKTARMENLSRKEFPLFLALCAKIS